MKKLYSIFFIAAIVALTFGMCCQPISDNSSGSNSDVYQNIAEKAVVFDDETAEGSIARNFYFMIDVSGSMSNGCSGKSKIEGAKEALLKFVNDMPDDINIGVQLFGTSNDVLEMIPLGPNNKQSFIQVIGNNLNPTGSTPIALATRHATDALIAQYKKQLGYGEYRMIIVADGGADSDSALRRALDNTLQYPWIGIYGIGLCMDRSHMLKDYALSYADADDYEQLQSALTETLAETDVFDISAFEAVETETN